MSTSPEPWDDSLVMAVAAAVEAAIPDDHPVVTSMRDVLNDYGVDWTNPLEARAFIAGTAHGHLSYEEAEFSVAITFTTAAFLPYLPPEAFPQETE